MEIGEISLAVIAVCMVVITIALLVLTVVMYKLLRKINGSVDTVNNQLKPAVVDLRKTILSFTEAFRLVNETISFIKRIKGNRKSGKDRAKGL